jgi:hypothetical protein
MATTDTCTACGMGEADDPGLVAWFVDGERRAIHTDCWIRAYHRSCAALAGNSGVSAAS